jgi:hypothetical protein
MDSMDFIWGELQQAIEMKILEEQQEASSDTLPRTPEKQQEFPKSQFPSPESEGPPGESFYIFHLKIRWELGNSGIVIKG